MPQADRAFAALSRRPAIHAVALLWIWLTATFAPMGATLHAMSHLRLPAVTTGGYASPRMEYDGAMADASARIDRDTAIAEASAHPAHDAASADTSRHIDPDSVAATAPPQDAGHRDTAAHCHVCDEWQFLNHALPSAVRLDVPALPAMLPRAVSLPIRVAAETPWILPRAPPTPLNA